MVQLNYRQKSNGQYILSKNDIEDIATAVLKDYAPLNLEIPTALDTMDFLQNYLLLTVKRKYIGVGESQALGAIVLTSTAQIPSLDDDYKSVILEETFGNVLICPALLGPQNAPRRRYTEMHEASHFILHKEYFEKLESSNKHNNSSERFIACRFIEMNSQDLSNDLAWREWQADRLAAALLMPQNVFCSYAKSVMRKLDINRGCLIPEYNISKSEAYDIIDDISVKFSVSHRATQIRMINLGLIRQTSILNSSY